MLSWNTWHSINFFLFWQLPQSMSSARLLFVCKYIFMYLHMYWEVCIQSLFKWSNACTFICSRLLFWHPIMHSYLVLFEQFEVSTFVHRMDRFLIQTHHQTPQNLIRLKRCQLLGQICFQPNYPARMNINRRTKPLSEPPLIMISLFYYFGF